MRHSKVIIKNAKTALERLDKMNLFCGMLVQFSHGTKCTRKRLLKICSTSLIDEAVDLKYIRELGKNDVGEIVYVITEKGRKKMNE